MSVRQHNGFAIALAWPQTYCKQPGSWYDGINSVLGISEFNYYKVGHAALVLVDIEKKECHYFDFGRYHTPFQYGRVRGSNTDHELKLEVKPEISGNGKILENYSEILQAIQLNEACHGVGDLYAAYCNINFNLAWDKVAEMQRNSPIPYGPFKFRGSNCSRFVNKAIMGGRPDLSHRIALNYFVPLTPTPISNVKALNFQTSVPSQPGSPIFRPYAKHDPIELKKTLKSPKRVNCIPEDAQWLSGEGAGSWFNLECDGDLLKVVRYSPKGEIECSGYFQNNSIKDIALLGRLKVTYPSNCLEVNIQNTSEKIRFERVKVPSASAVSFHQ